MNVSHQHQSFLPRTKDILLNSPVTLVVTALAISLWLFAPLESIWELRFTSDFSAYQLATCHLLHWSGEHLFWDLGMFALLGFLSERRMPIATVAAMAISAALIPLVVWFVQPEIGSYRGLSGIDSALFALLAASIGIEKIRDGEFAQGALFVALIGLLLGKIGFEFASQRTLFVTDVNFIAVPVAHLVGMSIGICLALAAAYSPIEKFKSIRVCVHRTT